VGVAVGDIQGDGKLDLILVGIELGKLHYRIANDLEENGHTGSEREIVVDDDDIRHLSHAKGLGASLWDVDRNGRQDLVVTWFYHGMHSNYIAVAILWNLDDEGNYDTITQHTIEKDLAWNIDGVGCEMVQLDDNPNPDLYYTYSKGNYYYRRVAYNLDAEGKPTVVRKLGGSRFLSSPSSSSEGMGVALAFAGGDFVRERSVFYPGTGKKLKTDTVMSSVKSTEKMEKIETTTRMELVKHQGKVISVIKDTHGHLIYSVMQDDESWSKPQELQLPDQEEDPSVVAKNDNNPILNYQYKYPHPVFTKYHLISDGEYLYVYFANAFGKLYVVRYILDKMTNQLVRPYDIRYRRSGQKCKTIGDIKEANKDKADRTLVDTLGYEDMDGHAFYEPIVQVSYLDDLNISVRDFSVHIVPTSLPDEERWQLFVLDTEGKVHEISFRRARESVCSDSSAFVYFEGFPTDANKTITNTEADKEIHLPGVTHRLLKEIKFGVSGLSSTLYANQQSCDGKIIRREQRIKLIVSSVLHPMEEVDYGIRATGVLMPIDTSEHSREDGACEEGVEAYSYTNTLGATATNPPFIYSSFDGFLHLFFGDDKHFMAEFDYDTLTDRWVDESSRRSMRSRISGGVDRYLYGNRRTPWHYYRAASDSIRGAATAIEFGSYYYNSDGDLVGVMRRLSSYTGDKKHAYIYRENIGRLKARYIGQNMIDPTLVGYIEGAPPVPQVNLTEKTNYNGITSVAMLEASHLRQTYVQSKDWGLDFHADGNYGVAAFSLDSQYGWLSENSVGYENVETTNISQSLKGEWDKEENVWKPYNIGTALVKAKKANIYGLYFDDGDDDDGNDRLYAYRSVPIPHSEEEQLTSFVINPAYVKNGDLKTYQKDDELRLLERSIKKREERIRAYYKQYKSSAFTSIPELDSISKRNIINEYYWSASGGARSKSTSYATSISESIGGSFHFQGMAGVALGDPLFGTFTLNVLAGGHVDKTFNKAEDTEDSFEIQTTAEVESGGVLDSELGVASGKVDYYKWKTLYQEPSSDNFNDFFDRVVDKEWLASDNVYAVRLREARERANRVWRIRHFVTFFSTGY